MQLRDSQHFRPNDELTQIVESYAQAEISEDDLELVTAAGMTDYQRFMEMVTKNSDGE